MHFLIEDRIADGAQIKFQLHQTQPQIARVISLITLQLGNEMMVSIHAEMRDPGSSRAMIENINEIEAGLKARFPTVRWSFFEPEMEGKGSADQDYAAQPG